MNWEIARAANMHVVAEYEKLRTLAGTLDRALQEAIDAYLKDKPREELPGSPPDDPADEIGWQDYFVRRGSLAYHRQLFDVGLEMKEDA